MLTVPNPIVFSYNRWVFNGSVRTKVNEKPVTSADNRTVKCSEITIECTGYLTEEDIAAAGFVTLDAYMQLMRQRLQVHGKNLVYFSKGYGLDLNINPTNATATSIRDVMMGPKPSQFVWWPLGGAAGCRGAGFSWTVTTWIAECENFPQNPEANRFIEISFPTTYDVDERGLVTITTNVTAAIPLSLGPNNTIVRTVDDSIAAIIRPVSVGFLRRHTRTISADRTTCNLTIVDRQIEIPYPDGCTGIEMKHRIVQKAPGAPIWMGTISGTVTMSPTADRFLAPQIFFNIAVQRMDFARRHAVFDAEGRKFVAGQPGIAMGKTEMEEDLFVNSARFTVHYLILGAPIFSVVSLSGMWRTIVEPPDVPQQHEWNAESANISLANNAQRFKGILKSSLGVDQDVIIDVCAGPAPAASVGASNSFGGGGEWSEEDTGGGGEWGEQHEPTDDDLNEIVLVSAEIESAEPDASWIVWECYREELVNNNTVVHKVLSGSVTSTVTQPIDPFNSVESVSGSTIAPTPGYVSTVDDVIQQIASPTMKLRLYGFGVRMGFRVDPPRVISYGGRDCVLDTSRITESRVPIASNIQAYRTDWDLVYHVPNAPEKSQLPANPYLQTDDAREKF